MTVNDSKERFSNRVRDYIKARPSYPKALFDCIKDEWLADSELRIADVGAGTGIFSKGLIESGFNVDVVEPNVEMLNAAKKYLGEKNSSRYYTNSAEETGLPDSSVDAISCAQAFHWFANENAVNEFSRVLKKDGQVLLVWNERDPELSSFNLEYEKILTRYQSDYSKVNHRRYGGHTCDELFGKNTWTYHEFKNFQDLDLDTVIGRLASSSYLPSREDPEFNPMTHDATEIFKIHQKEGLVRMDYRTVVYRIHSINQSDQDPG